MARRKKREGHLHKVLGVPALFSTAYGNVGSSIYYALGVVALYALGLTPLVFMLTGLLFVTTAFSYAEATTIFPEAGGSSSFARHTFNEFVSFGAGWALMLDYIITIAISAFFVPNYLAAFWPILKTWPYNSIGGIAVIVFLVAINIIGIKEAARLNIILAIADLSTQVLLAVVGLFVFLSPRLLITQIHFGTAPTWHQFIYGISIGTVAYTGIETISNMAEESANPGRDVPRAVKFVLLAVLGVYSRSRWSACRPCRCSTTRAGQPGNSHDDPAGDPARRRASGADGARWHYVPPTPPRRFTFCPTRPAPPRCRSSRPARSSCRAADS